ncbi:MAG TPA: (Fe-S)-binding protein, partial [Polyangiaceae bacterium]|nr:(Fe-S)-binding protein [Polyangiaceae bacterium]
MNPLAMALVMGSLIGFFGWTARRRFTLLGVGAPTWESRIANVTARLRAVWTYAIFQKKMRYYLVAGLAHQLVFLGFGVLLLRTLVLWGRGFDPAFNMWVLGPDTWLGATYSLLKELFGLLVLLGVSAFVYYRVIRPQKRMTLSGEGLLILGIIVTMMVADFVYDGATLVVAHDYAR